MSLGTFGNRRVGLNLMAMDNGAGWLYHMYQMRVGLERKKMIDKFIKKRSSFERIVDQGLGDKTIMQEYLEKLMALGEKKAKINFLKELSELEKYTPKVRDGKGGWQTSGDTRTIKHPYSKAEYKALIKALAKGAKADPSQTEMIERMIQERTFSVQPTMRKTMPQNLIERANPPKF